uniref:Uncharacterized protein n=1 Tax=Rhizophora mucronata TaxID=61149 RepID=A0A2P2PB68_RHIMU
MSFLESKELDAVNALVAAPNPWKTVAILVLLRSSRFGDSER